MTACWPTGVATRGRASCRSAAPRRASPRFNDHLDVLVIPDRLRRSTVHDQVGVLLRLFGCDVAVLGHHPRRPELAEILPVPLDATTQPEVARRIHPDPQGEPVTPRSTCR